MVAYYRFAMTCARRVNPPIAIPIHGSERIMAERVMDLAELPQQFVKEGTQASRSSVALRTANCLVCKPVHQTHAER